MSISTPVQPARPFQFRDGDIRWNLGSCDRHFPGYISIDICDPCDIQWDLRQPWPATDSSVDEIRAYDIIEHLPDKIFTMNEAWRVLKPNGLFDIEVPTTDGPGAWQDPQHVSYWNRNSFFYFTDGDPHRERFGKHYGVLARFRVLQSALVKEANFVVKLKIGLQAVKRA